MKGWEERGQKSKGFLSFPQKMESPGGGVLLLQEGYNRTKGKSGESKEN